MDKLYVSYTERSTGGERHSDEPYSSRAPTYNEVTITGLHTNPPKSLYKRSVDVRSPSVNLNDRVFLLAVTHSDGDSFGTSHGNVHFEGVYSNVKDAKAVAKSIKNGTYEGYMPWDGYFSHLEDIEIHAMYVTETVDDTDDTDDDDYDDVNIKIITH